VLAPASAQHCDACMKRASPSQGDESTIVAVSLWDRRRGSNAPPAPGYSVESIAADDAPRLARFGNAYSHRWLDRDIVSVEQMQLIFSNPQTTPADSIRLLVASNGRPAAIGLLFPRDPYVKIRIWGLVAEDDQGIGL